MTAECDKCIRVKPNVLAARTKDQKLRMLCAECREELGATPLKSSRPFGQRR